MCPTMITTFRKLVLGGENNTRLTIFNFFKAKGELGELPELEGAFVMHD